MRRPSNVLVIAAALLVAVCGGAAAEQITNGPQPGGAVVGAKRGRDRDGTIAARAAAGLASAGTPKPGMPALHANEQPVAGPLRAAAPGACVTSASVICWENGGVVPGWPASADR